MKITILAIGKKHDPKLRVAIDHYTARLSHYVSLEWKLIEAKLTTKMTEQQIRDAESTELARYLPDGASITILDEHGSQFSSPELAEQLQQYMNQSKKQLIFIIGGAYGINKSLINRADVIWSFGKLVFPHQLVRLLLSEQLYRAYTILAGERYHHQ